MTQPASGAATLNISELQQQLFAPVVAVNYFANSIKNNSKTRSEAPPTTTTTTPQEQVMSQNSSNSNSQDMDLDMQSQQPTVAATPHQPKKVSSSSSSSSSAVVTHAGQGHIIMVKIPDTWKLVQPQSHSAAARVRRAVIASIAAKDTKRMASVIVKGNKSGGGAVSGGGGGGNEDSSGGGVVPVATTTAAAPDGQETDGLEREDYFIYRDENGDVHYLTDVGLSSDQLLNGMMFEPTGNMLTGAKWVKDMKTAIRNKLSLEQHAKACPLEVPTCLIKHKDSSTSGTASSSSSSSAAAAPTNKRTHDVADGPTQQQQNDGSCNNDGNEEEKLLYGGMFGRTSYDEVEAECPVVGSTAMPTADNLAYIEELFGSKDILRFFADESVRVHDARTKAKSRSNSGKSRSSNTTPADTSSSDQQQQQPVKSKTLAPAPAVQQQPVKSKPAASTTTTSSSSVAVASTTPKAKRTVSGITSKDRFDQAMRMLDNMDLNNALRHAAAKVEEGKKANPDLFAENVDTSKWKTYGHFRMFVLPIAYTFVRRYCVPLCKRIDLPLRQLKEQYYPKGEASTWTDYGVEMILDKCVDGGTALQQVEKFVDSIRSKDNPELFAPVTNPKDIDGYPAFKQFVLPIAYNIYFKLIKPLLQLCRDKGLDDDLSTLA